MDLGLSFLGEAAAESTARIHTVISAPLCGGADATDRTTQGWPVIHARGSRPDSGPRYK